MRGFLIALNAFWAAMWTLTLANSLHEASHESRVAMLIMAVTFMFTAVELLRK